MQGSGAQMIVDRHMADWIQQNFVKVAMVPVKVEEIPFDELVLPEKKAKEIRATVASLRLDAGRGRWIWRFSLENGICHFRR